MARRRRGAGISTLFVVLGLVAVLGGTFAAGFFTGRHWERVRVMTGLVKPQAGKEPERRALAGRATDSPPVPALTFYQELTAPLASFGRQGGASPLPPVAPPTGRSPRATVGSERSASSTVPVPAASTTAKAAASSTVPVPAASATAKAPKSDPAASESSVAAAPEVKRASAPEPKPASPPDQTSEPKADAVTQARGDTPNVARPERARGYTVQVAAYATRAQAESLAQRLGALGFQGDVTEITTPGGVRYRVRVGTYPTKEAARDAAGRLGAATSLGGFVATR